MSWRYSLRRDRCVFQRGFLAFSRGRPHLHNDKWWRNTRPRWPVLHFFNIRLAKRILAISHIASFPLPQCHIDANAIDFSLNVNFQTQCLKQILSSCKFEDVFSSAQWPFSLSSSRDRAPSLTMQRRATGCLLGAICHLCTNAMRRSRGVVVSVAR